MRRKTLFCPTLWSRLRAVCRDRDGSVLMLTGFMLPVVLGFSAMGIDLTLWYLERRELQSVVDTASVAGAYEAIKGGADTAVLAAVNADATRNKFFLGSGETLLANAPPTSGAHIGSSKHVEVIATRPADLKFAQYFLSKPVLISARAVAGAVAVGEHCIIALDKTADRALEFGGTADVSIDCGVASNSNSDMAIYVGGNASLEADPAQAYGDIYVNGNASLITKHPPQPYSQRVDDPYGPEGRDLQVPTKTPCTASNLKLKNTVTVSPGHYCGGLSVTNGNITFLPGTYVIDGSFTTSGTSTLTGDGVTFILSGDKPSDIGSVKFAGGTQADLTAPTTGDYAGVLFYQNQAANTSGDNQFVGGSNMVLEGALYFPRQNVSFAGGSGAKPACLQAIARTVKFLGNSYVTNDPDYCDDLGVSKVAQTRIRVVE